MIEGSGDGLTQELFDEAMAKAFDDGFEVVRGGPRLLLLDLDTPHAVLEYERGLSVLRKTVGTVVKIEEWKSKSGNLHAKLTMAVDMLAIERIALQAALGSDGVREMLALKRLENGIDEPSTLFKPKAGWAKVAA